MTTAARTLAEQWRATWPEALAAWSPYTQLREPVFFEKARDGRSYGMEDEIAAIRLVDQLVMVNLETVRARALDDLALPILAHEIGHHVYVPANLTDNGRMLAAMRRALYGLRPDLAGMVANLYGDLLLNDRLQRRGVDIAGVYRKLNEGAQGDPGQVWRVYTRAYEELWRLAPGTLGPKDLTDEMKADAALIARLIRHYAADWLRGARRFATILYPYLLEDEKKKGHEFAKRGLWDTKGAGKGASGETVIPDGLAEIDPTEVEDDDEFDREIEDPLGEDRQGRGGRTAQEASNTEPKREGKGKPGSQFRQPFEYGELLKALGLDLDQHAVTTKYYRERALPYLIPFPTRRKPRTTEPIPEGYDTWEATDGIEELDALGSVVRSPVVIPGITTVRRTWGESPGHDPNPAPMDLDIYVDSSGSMPSPAHEVSYLALAGTILALSALRMGAKVQATLWSGARQFETTQGFVRDENKILGVITGFIGGGTAFPIHVLRKTYEDRKKDDPPAHIVVISDDGVDTMLQPDEKKTPGEKIAADALAKARGGGTLVLNIPVAGKKRLEKLEKIGYRIHAVQEWEQLVEFARRFVRENYRTD